MGRKTRRKTNQKTKRKTNRKSRIRKQSIKINTILGMGKDGCIVESISCENFSKENGYVAKILFQDKVINRELHSILEDLDPTNQRFNRYFFPDQSNCIKNENYANDLERCSSHLPLDIVPTIIFQKKVKSFNKSN